MRNRELGRDVCSSCRLTRCKRRYETVSVVTVGELWQRRTIPRSFSSARSFPRRVAARAPSSPATTALLAAADTLHFEHSAIVGEIRLIKCSGYDDCTDVMADFVRRRVRLDRERPTADITVEKDLRS
jgi:hypothetical protein